MRITADTGRCIGSGTCVLTDPDVFGQSDDYGTVILHTDDVDGERLTRAESAVLQCPGHALSLTKR